MLAFSSIRIAEQLRTPLGMTESQPINVLHHERRELTDRLVASLGACLAAGCQATLAELAKATDRRVDPEPLVDHL